MSICERCGAEFSCAMRDGGDAPCWCTALPPLALTEMPGGAPGEPARCLCPACLRVHIEQMRESLQAGVPGRDEA